jgi:cytochrome c oxidase subunit 4
MSKSLTYFLTWIGLMVLLALTAWSSYIPLGPWNTVINMAISVMKTLLIATFFMHLRNAGGLLRIAALTGLIWLALLFGLSWTDIATRPLGSAPWTTR